jgi:hypothetical protein
LRIASDAVVFDYRLTGHGWGDAAFRICEQTASLSASYLGDALGELLEAIVALTRGEERARAP